MRLSNKQLLIRLTACHALLFLLSTSVQAATLFEDDFEAPLFDPVTPVPTPNPVLEWKTPFDPVTNQFGMMFGEGDMYTRSLAYKHSGKYSLRLNFAGRNNFCNVCLSGSKTFFMKSGENNRTFFQDNAGTDLTAEFPELPDSQMRVYNSTDRWARWQVQSVTGDRLDFVGNAPAQNDLQGDGDFDDGDEIRVVKICNSGDRRSDCNLGINYLREGGGGPVSTTNFPPGGTLARRMYIYLPSNTILPNIGLKLGYIHFKRATVYPSIIVIAVQRSNELVIDNSSLYGKYEFTKLKLKTDTWYYFEEVFTRENPVGASNGTYQLYIAEAGRPDTLYVDQSNINYGELKDISIIGNWQKLDDAIGSVYIDDVKIATSRIGQTGNDIVPLPAGELETN